MLQPVHNLHVLDILLTYLQDPIQYIFPIGTPSYYMNYLYLLAKRICDPILLSFDVFDLKDEVIDRGQLSSLLGIQIQLVKQVSQPIVITHKYKPHAKKIVPPHL